MPVNRHHIIRGQTEPTWKLAGYESFEDAVNHHFSILDAATKMLRHWVEGSRKHWLKFPIVTNDGRKVILWDGKSKFMPVDPLLIGFAASNDARGCLIAIKSEWSRVCARL